MNPDLPKKSVAGFIGAGAIHGTSRTGGTAMGLLEVGLAGLNYGRFLIKDSK